MAILSHFAVDIKCVAACFNCIPFNGYDALDKISFSIVWRDKNENVTTGGLMEIKNFDVRAGDFNAVDKFADQNPVSNKERIFH